MKQLRVTQDELDSPDGYFCLWNEKPFTGVCYHVFSDGKLSGEQKYVNGVLEGLSRVWYHSGNLKIEEQYIAGYLHGMTREWFEDGNLEHESIFEFGVSISSKQWDKDGKVIQVYEISEQDVSYNYLLMRRRQHSE